MAEEVLKNVLEWCFKNTNVLDAKDNDYNEGERFIHFAAKNGYVSVVKQLIEKGVSPDLKDDTSYTPLHNASYYGHVEVAKLLFQNGADPNSLSGDKCTPIHLATATEKGHAEIVNLLIQNGANVNSLDSNNQTPLHIAAYIGHFSILLQPCSKLDF